MVYPMLIRLALPYNYIKGIYALPPPTTSRRFAMPFKSKAQERKFRVLESQGKLPKGTADQWLKETKNPQGLPEHVKKKGK